MGICLYRGGDEFEFVFKGRVVCNDIGYILIYSICQ